MIYVPDTSYACYVVQNDTTLRAYKTKPYNPSYGNTINIAYRDYYYTSNYLYQDGTQQFGNYSQIPVCLDNNVLTDNYYYRNDFDRILIIFFIIVFFVFFILKKFIRVFFHGFREC